MEDEMSWLKKSIESLESGSMGDSGSSDRFESWSTSAVAPNAAVLSSSEGDELSSRNPSSSEGDGRSSRNPSSEPETSSDVNSPYQLHAKVRLFQCGIGGCKQEPMPKRNNIERHVWTQHVRDTLGFGAHVKYTAQYHKMHVDKYVTQSLVDMGDEPSKRQQVTQGKSKRQYSPYQPGLHAHPDQPVPDSGNAERMPITSPMFNNQALPFSPFPRPVVARRIRPLSARLAWHGNEDLFAPQTATLSDGATAQQPQSMKRPASEHTRYVPLPPLNDTGNNATDADLQLVHDLEEDRMNAMSPVQATPPQRYALDDSAWGQLEDMLLPDDFSSMYTVSYSPDCSDYDQGLPETENSQPNCA